MTKPESSKKENGNQKTTTHTMEFRKRFPEKLLDQIVARFSLRCLVISRLVCRQWRDLPDNKDFVDLQFALARQVLLFNFPFKRNRGRQYLDEERANLEPIGLIDTRSILSGSSNGLICILDTKVHPRRYIICNPLLGYRTHNFQLPLIKSSLIGEEKASRTTAFGYVSSTRQYKVVRVLTTPVEEHCYIYTIEAGGNGGDQWMHRGSLPDFYKNKVGTLQPPITMNGMVYWVRSRLGVNSTRRHITLVVLDLETERFEMVKPPFHPKKDWRTVLLGWDGRLSLCYIAKTRLIICVLRDVVEKRWESPMECRLHDRDLKCEDMKKIMVLAIMDGRDDLMLLKENRTVCAYNLKTRIVRTVFERPHYLPLEDRLITGHFVTHIGTFKWFG